MRQTFSDSMATGLQLDSSGGGDVLIIYLSVIPHCENTPSQETTHSAEWPVEC